MAPKPLTDSPENLREAIDWLVHVKHCDGLSTLSSALATLFDNVAQDAEKSLSSLPDSDRPSARDVVSKLRAFQSTLPKDSENPNKNIIHNLCTSAGSLLGYRSPGTYDGSGIVYGNASRLCDAILAFLYAVFSDVHDNQPYVAGRSILYDDVIGELKSQLWRGHKGFCQVIHKVANGLQRYNAAVKASNEKVKKPIETVLNYVNPGGELRRGIHALQITETSTSTQDERTVESAVSLLEGCKEVAKVFSKSITAAKDAIDDLNPKLRRKLENARRSFFNHVDWLSKWSKKGEKKQSDRMVQKIKSRLKRLANAVKDKIKLEVRTIVDLLKDRVREIKMKLEGITASLGDYVKELGQWMGEAKEFIKKVKEYVRKIMEQLYGENRKAIDEAAADIDSQLGKRVEELNQWIEKAENAVNVAKEKADDIFKRLDKDSSTTIGGGLQKIEDAKGKIESVNSELETVHKDLGGWKNAAKGVLSKAAAKAVEVRDKLDPERHDENHTIGKNLNEIDISNKGIEQANESLREQTEKLNQWIAEADGLREKAQEKAQEVYDNLKVHDELSEKIGKIKEANDEIQKINSEMSAVDSKLGEWNEQARDVIQDVVKKAEDVYKKLNDKDSNTDIGKGITQIKAARAKVEEVDNGLQDVNTDLEKWRKAAETVLDIAVKRAEHVHDKLDPTKNDDSHLIGKNIQDIGDAKKELDGANEQLKIQVESLSKWIDSAEEIRAAAETKAKEAYDKLQVHEALSENVKRIVDANKAINGVHSAVEEKLKNLGTWKNQAGKVISGAIDNAQFVHERLDYPSKQQNTVAQKLGEVAKHNIDIQRATETLGENVGYLGKWKEAAEKVIDKAGKNCDHILKRVDKNHKDNESGKQGPKIFLEAKKLQDQGIKLLTAASEAKQKVEERVKSALDAVKAMDTDLKADLKVVKDKIKEGIKSVIKELEVEKLGERVKQDLKELRERIEGLNKGDTLVSVNLSTLEQAKQKLIQKTEAIKEAEQELQTKFESEIKGPLEGKVKTVEKAINALGEKIGVNGMNHNQKDKLHKIFEHVKKEVAIVKGNPGRNAFDSNAKGLDGIVSRTKGLVLGFGDTRNHGFSHRVDGWIESILGINKNKDKAMDAVTSWITAHNDQGSENSKVSKDQFKQKIKSALGGQIGAGQAHISTDVTDKIVKNLTKVKAACDKFVEELDKQLTNTQIETFVGPIVQQIQSSLGSGRSGGDAEHLKTAVRTALIALCSCVRQVASEIQFIGISMFGERIDTIKPTVDDLNTKLGNATSSALATGTAKAVDNSIGDVKTMVESTIKKKFQQDVKKPVETAVQGLEKAVTDYDTKAKEQVREAGKKAIAEAAKEISGGGDGSQIDVKSTMGNFHEAHENIKNSLVKHLQEKADKFIGTEDTTDGVQGNQKVKLSGEFKGYDGHVNYGPLTKFPYGKLLYAIDSIKSEGLRIFNEEDEKKALNTGDSTFTGPFNKIEKELNQIADLVSDKRQSFTSELGPNRNSLKEFVKQIREGLTKSVPGVFTNGLDEIKKAIGDLQKEPFSTKPSEIGKVVTEIRKEIEVLKEKLKSDGGKQDGVIDQLTNMQSKGLAVGTWAGKDGLGKIESEIQEQNKKLSKRTEIIGDTIENVKEEIQDLLRRVRMKLDDTLMDDAVVYRLKQLEKKIGLGRYEDDGTLQKFHCMISELWAKQFSKKPSEIERAIHATKARLQGIRDVLQSDNNSGVIDILKDVRDVGLSKNLWKKYDNKKGLEAIETEFKRQQSDLTGHPEKIHSGVNLITKEIESLRNALKDEYGYPNDDVINRLEYLISLGFNGVEWQNGRGKKFAGLQQIQDDLKWQNTQLSAATAKIEESTKTVMRETQEMLRKVSKKLSDELMDDDILDNLRQLQKKIGLDRSNGGSLQTFQREISRLQEDAFTKSPAEIRKAKGVIEQELKKYKDDLQSFVTDTLSDLIGNGLSDEQSWNGYDAKGLDYIKDNLERQQWELSQQPTEIEAGVTVITEELQNFRDELQGKDGEDPHERGVMENLEFLTKHIGASDNTGLKKIKRDMESLNRSQVPLITKHLNAMSTEITTTAGNLGWNLNQLENPHIDGKLKGIRDGLGNLRLTDLVEAIKLCDDFLSKADEIERNTIDALWKHVDHEVDDAVNDLTKQARQHYVDSVKEALQLFARKVNEDLEQLPGDINHDLTIGHKGFMNAVESENSGNINKLKCLKSRELKHLSAAFAGFFGEVNEYVRKETERVHRELDDDKNPSLPPTEEPYTPKLNDVYEALTALLDYLKNYDGGADKLTELVERLTSTMSDLVPSDFKHPSTPLLDTVARGLSKFAGKYHNTYISAYSGQRCREEHAHKYAKVFLSMIPMTYQGLTKLMRKCADKWKHLHISKLTAAERDNPLGNYLARCGYRVSSDESGQDGELNNMFSGGGIYELLTTPIEDVDIEVMVDGEPIKNGINFVHIISLLYNLLCHYYQVSHIRVPPEPRYPCTVRDMLSWLSGLQYTLVADKLPDHCKALLNRRCHDGYFPNKDDPIMAKCIGQLPYTIATTCSRSNALLTSIQGNGHGFDLAAYPYLVDFSNNRAKLHYPNDPGELLDMLRDIVCRLCRVLYFLYSQCCRSTARIKGWRECAYGRQVQSHHWQCDTFDTQSADSATTTSATVTTAAKTTSATTTPTHGCPPTSPLQSFLSDSCHGLLPHTLTAADGTIECANCTDNLLGQQCLTPLGFWDLGFAASISGTGWDLAKSLGDMCRDADSCLFVLCRILSYLCPAAPSSLADVFALYAQMLRKWDHHDRVKHRGGTYTDASDLISHLNTDGIGSLFPLWKELHGSYENPKLTSAIASLAGHDYESHDALSSLFNDSTCKPPSGCAPYLQPLGLHAYHTYPQKHAGLYITWIMYLAWQFWELLSSLLHALENIDCTASGCATCPCQPGTHGDKDTCHCPSIVQCAGPLPTLYRYGFTYRNANLLVAANRTMRCGDVNTQLKKALHSAHFTELFRQIDHLIWHIRMPFVYFLIALWAVVALYILHTFLYRMDVLCIRSHLLTTKASHLIDVKALLTKGRKMLSLYKDVDYFDDDPIGNLAPQ